MANKFELNDFRKAHISHRRHRRTLRCNSSSSFEIQSGPDNRTLLVREKNQRH